MENNNNQQPELNPDGTPKTPNPDGNAPAVKSAEELQAELLAERDARRLEKEAMSSTIAELRVKAREQAPQGPDDAVDARVKAVLADTNRKNALERFMRSRTELNPANDTGGVKKAAFERALARINHDGSMSEDDFMNDFKDALLLSGIPLPTPDPGNPLDEHAATSLNGRAPAPSGDARLNADQERIRVARGWTVEKYLEQKARHPAIIP